MVKNEYRLMVDRPSNEDRTPGAATGSMYLTRAELAWHLRIQLRTLDDLVAQGKIPQPLRLTRKTVRWPRTVLLEIQRSLTGEA